MLGVLLFSGCSQASKQSSGSNAYKSEATLEMDSAQVSVQGENSARKMIITASFQVETTDFASSANALEQAVNDGGGYIESLRQQGVSDSNGSGTYVLRIPVDALGQFTDALAQIGTITDRSQSTDDITDEYYDVDARLKAKQAQKERILALIEQAETLDDLLILEQELAELQAEIDSLTGQQQRYDNLVEYATVTVTLWQTALTESGNTPFGPQVTKAFRDSFAFALEIVKGIGIALIWLLPYLIVAAIIVTVVLLATRKKRRARKEARAAAQAQYRQPVFQPPMTPPAPVQPPIAPDSPRNDSGQP